MITEMENFKFKKHDGHAKQYIHENYKEIKEGEVQRIRVFDEPNQFGEIAEIYIKGKGIGLGTEEMVTEIPSNIKFLD